MEVIAVVSQKGGVGKTPTSINLAFALARRPKILTPVFSEAPRPEALDLKKILLVDMDPQASLTEYLLAEETYEQDVTVHNALMRIEPIDPIEIRPNIHLLNAHDQLFEAEYKLLTMSNPDGRLKAVLNRYGNNYDFVVIDTPPNLSLLTRNALGAAQQVLIPVRPELIAQRTLKRLHDTLDDVRTSGLNPDLKIWWILPTVYDSRKLHHKEILQALQQEYGDMIYSEPSRETTKYNDAVTIKTDISELDKALGEYWDRLAATHPSLRKEVVNAS